ncbi:putative disease resistance RPP13-like protein 1 [Carex rostrata]
MAGNLITSLLSLATNLLPSITASAHAPSSSSSNSNNSVKGRAVQEDMERLMQTLKWIKATLYDAEEREIRDLSVKLWLKEIKKVAYDAEDVLSEYRYEVTSLQAEARKASQASDSLKEKLTKYIVPIPDGMVDRLNKIRSRFDEIAKDREALQLRESDGLKRLNNKILRPPTSHMVDEASIFGRGAEIKEIINLLLSEKEKSFSVISIVGKGGLGKTTIAQLVYKDLRDSQCFDLFGWVCISEEFDVRRLIKATIESIFKINYGVSELSLLQEELAKIVKGKTILLVLDDVWNENQSLWELFRVPLKEAKMVRILVTTRNKMVAEVMQTKTCFRPTDLPEDSCWQLFQHYALSDTSDTIPRHLIGIGREIMRKCGGLPLAVKSIASLLRHKTYEEDWREILESDLWESNPSNDIFPALQISYAHLPTHLKPCFLFCSMYPKDYLLHKMNLIELWISHGYIESRGKRKIIEIGVEYYEELKEKSFLDDCSDQSLECCKLHDIIHDLARLNSENEHYSMEINQPFDMQKGSVPRETYHLYVRGFVGYVNQILQQNLKGLRTLSVDVRECDGDFEHEYCISNTKAMDLNSKMLEYYEYARGFTGYVNQILQQNLKGLRISTDLRECGENMKHKHCINNTKAMDLSLKPLEYHEECSADVTICNLPNFEALRVLELKGYGLTKIPHSIFKLKHLAYLGITASRLKMLPLSIGFLYNLQTLILDCFFLEYIPETIGNLANLQFLYIQSREVKKLPKSLCSLSNLLRLVIKSDNLEEVPLDLQNLYNLHALAIHSTRIQALPNSIGCLCNLQELNLLPLSGSVKDNCKLDYVPHGLVNFPAIKSMAAWLRVKTVAWLKDMNDLKGNLSFEGLGNMSNLEDAQHANLRNKCKLETLDLCWDYENYDLKSALILSIIPPESCEGMLFDIDDVDFSLLECLHPHPNLKKLRVRCYPSAVVPGWMRDPSSLQSIQEVLLEYCDNIQSLPRQSSHSKAPQVSGML